MKFINRKTELEQLEKLYELSSRRLFTVLIFGPRRIGKTELIKHFSRDKKHHYFFVYSLKTPRSLLKEFETELKRINVLGDRESLKNFGDFLDILFERCKNRILIFDEFQNFRDVYPAFFSHLQRKIDENQREPIMVVFLGSVIGLVKGVFEDMKSPLYGRLKAKMKIEPLAYSDVRRMLKAVGYARERDFVTLYSLFGGYPKYYVAMEDYELKDKTEDVLRMFFLQDNSVFGYEVLDILRQEFGKRKGTYYTILEAIATGHTKLSEIASYAGMSVTSISRYLAEIMNYYELIARLTPVTEKRGSKKSVYKIKSPAVRFWFRYIHRNLSLFEGKSYKMLEEIILKDLDSYVGQGFEEISQEFLTDMNTREMLPFKFSTIGGWWHKEEEIDIVAFDRSRNILFAECEWRNKKTGKSVLSGLLKKANNVNWYNEDRREHYAVISKKGFTAQAEKYAEKNNILLFDLNDMKTFYDGAEKTG